jgi:hypothetical protein
VPRKKEINAVTLPGELILSYFSAILISVAASAVIILLYRRAVLVGMLERSGAIKDVELNR